MFVCRVLVWWCVGMVMCCYGGVLVWWSVVMLVCRVLVW